MPKFNRIIPLLVYEDIPAAHDFLVNAFGFEPGGVDRNAEGQPVHAEVRAGDAPRLPGRRLRGSRRDMPYGQREYGARDPEGHRWWFATPLR